MDGAKELSAHWPLLVLLGGTIMGVALFLRLVATVFDSRADERMKLALSNGVGEMLRGQVKAAVLEALAEHQVQCPHAQRVTDLTDRVVSLERRG